MRLIRDSQKLPNELRVLDLCTGTGCIPLLFHHELYAARKDVDLRAVGIDISDKALQLAVHNLQRVRKQKSWVHRGAIGFMKADVLASPFAELSYTRPAVPTALRFAMLPSLWDVVISNPPYISPRGYWSTTTRSVRGFEPKLALVPPSKTGKDDTKRGDAFYLPILRIASDVDARVVLLEIADLDQAIRVARAARALNIFDGIEIWREQPDEPSEIPAEVEGFPVLGQGNGRSVVCWRGLGTAWLGKTAQRDASSASAVSVFPATAVAHEATSDPETSSSRVYSKSDELKKSRALAFARRSPGPRAENVIMQRKPDVVPDVERNIAPPSPVQRASPASKERKAKPQRFNTRPSPSPSPLEHPLRSTASPEPEPTPKSKPIPKLKSTPKPNPAPKLQLGRPKSTLLLRLAHTAKAYAHAVPFGDIMLAKQAIASELGYAVQTVYRGLLRLQRDGVLERKDRWAERDARIVELRREGKQYKDISKIVGVNESKIWRVLKRGGAVHAKGVRAGRGEWIKRLRSEGKRYEDISQIVGVHTSTVWGVLKRKRGLVYTKGWRAERREQIKRLKSEGKDNTEIGRIVGVSQGTVRRWLKREGVFVYTKEFWAEREERIKRLKNEGKSNAEIGEIVGVSLVTVRKWLKR